MQIKKSELKKIIKEELGKLMFYPNLGMLGGARSRVWEQGVGVTDLNLLQRTLPKMTISEIATVISKDWKNVWFGAKPYLQAMYSLRNITDNYYEDSGSSIIAYFLGNAQTWKGPVARLVKIELNKRLKKTYR